MSARRTLIVDDERLARRRLTKLLATHAQIEVAAEAEDLDGAVACLEADPSLELVFLDIQMPGGSGFELFERMQVHASVVFVTAYDAHALRAFEVNALDYLLKPVDPARLARTLARLGRTREQWPAGALRASDRVRLPLGDASRFVAVEELACVRAAGDYSEVCLRSGEVELVRVTMRAWAQRLPESGFVRVHRSAIINLHAVRRLRPGSGSTQVLELEGVEAEVPVSRQRLRVLRELLEGRDR